MIATPLAEKTARPQPPWQGTHGRLPIYANLHRIEGLSEWYFYCQDDVLATKPYAEDLHLHNGKIRFPGSNWDHSPVLFWRPGMLELVQSRAADFVRTSNTVFDTDKTNPIMTLDVYMNYMVRMGWAEKVKSFCSGMHTHGSGLLGAKGMPERCALNPGKSKQFLKETPEVLDKIRHWTAKVLAGKWSFVNVQGPGVDDSFQCDIFRFDEFPKVRKVVYQWLEKTFPNKQPFETNEYHMPPWRISEGAPPCRCRALDGG